MPLRKNSHVMVDDAGEANNVRVAFQHLQLVNTVGLNKLLGILDGAGASLAHWRPRANQGGKVFGEGVEEALPEGRNLSTSAPAALESALALDASDNRLRPQHCHGHPVHCGHRCSCWLACRSAGHCFILTNHGPATASLLFGHNEFAAP